MNTVHFQKTAKFGQTFPLKMTYYQQQFISIREKSFPKDYLCKQVIRGKEFIDSHFHNPIVLQDIAQEAYFSKFHFLRLFKLIYGKTPHQYLTEVRIEQAKQLLKTDITISEVCFAVGFDSVSSFKGLFKRYAQHLPKAIRLPSTHYTIFFAIFTLFSLVKKKQFSRHPTSHQYRSLCFL